MREHLFVAPTLITAGYGEREGQAPRVPGIDKPLGTVVAQGRHHALVAAFLAQHNTGMVGHDARKPLSTIVGSAAGARAASTQGLVTSHLLKLHGTTRRSAFSPGSVGQQLGLPFPTVRAEGTHLAEVRAFLIKYYGTDQDPRLREPLHTLTTKDRFGLVTVAGVDFAIADIGMRMLAPRELFRAQGFPDTYRIDIAGPDGAPLTKSAQVRCCGNSVCPPLARALVVAQFADEAARVEAL